MFRSPYHFTMPKVGRQIKKRSKTMRRSLHMYNITLFTLKFRAIPSAGHLGHLPQAQQRGGANRLLKHEFSLFINVTPLPVFPV